jgi:hypothetical protein
MLRSAAYARIDGYPIGDTVGLGAIREVGFLGLGKKEKEHKEKQRKFELADMKRKEELAGQEQELAKLELAIKRAELEKRAREAGITIPTTAAKAEGLVYLGSIDESGFMGWGRKARMRNLRQRGKRTLRRIARTKG